ncbi:MAG TPA: response regulator [Chloroflexota bacterium]|jgi:DNA-binding response OmpR family regulator
MRIVVADDEPDIRRLVAFALRRRGYEVAEAAAGDAALDLVRTEVPDLVVLDVMMPGMNGTEVARALGEDERTAGIPVLLLSARDQAAEIEEGMTSGARAYMAKPFAPPELAERVASLLTASTR